MSWVENRLIEEILPFLPYRLRRRRLSKKALKPEDFIKSEPYCHYSELSDEEIRERLKEEHERAKTMDEKTFKMTLALTVGLTVLGSTTSILIRGTNNSLLRVPTAVTAGLAIFYSMCGGLIAIGALRTLYTFGYGSEFRIKLKGDRAVSVNALVSQEKINIVRHLRNESAYQCLRNGFICLFVSLTFFAIAIVCANYAEKNTAPGDMNQQTMTISDWHQIEGPQ